MAGVVPFPNTAPAAWNSVGLGALTIPGICTLAVVVGQEVEVKKPKGKAGATTTVQGPNPAKVTIKTKLLRQSQLDVWAECVKVLRPAKASGSPLPLKHPKASLYGIAAVTIIDITDDANEEKGDEIPITITCVEFKPPPKKSATKTSKQLEPRDNSLTSQRHDVYNQVEKPSRDKRNTAPRKP